MNAVALADDLELLRRIQNGEEVAFEGLFQRYYAVLVGFARRMLTDWELAEEAVQDVFVVFWEKREAVTIQQSLKSYLYASVYHKCLRHTRHQKVRQRHREEVLSHSEEADVSDVMEAFELEQQIAKCIEKLPEQCRKVFSLSRMEGKKYQEIADELGISIKTVEIHISKALKMLREDLKEYLVTLVGWVLLASLIFVSWQIGVNIG